MSLEAQQSDLPEIPKGWCWTTLGQIAEIKLGKMLSKKAFAEDLNQLPYLRNQNVRWFSIDLSDLKSMGFKEAELERYRVEPDDLLICEGGEPGRCAVYKGGPTPLMYQKALHRLRPFGRLVDPHFVQYFIVRYISDSTVFPRQAETTIKHLPLEKMLTVPFSLPPVEEQQRIVAKIEELFSDLEAGVAALERVRANLKRYRASLLKAAVEGRLTEQWRLRNPSAEPASQLLQRILEQRRRKWEEEKLAQYEAKGKKPPKNWSEKYKEPAAPDVRNLPELPEGWCWATVDAISEVCGGLTKGQKRSPEALVSEVPYLRVANVQRGFLDLSEVKMIQATPDEIEKLRLMPGDILFTEGGDRDKLGRGWVWRGEIEECIHQNHVFRVRPLLDDLQSEFVSCHGNTFGRFWFLRAGRQSVNLASINMTILKRFPVPLPPVCEQKEIVQILQNESVWLEHCIGQVDSSLLRASNLRHSILREAFRGKLVPQDPDDEPADILLERIRAQRSTQPKRTRRRKLASRQLSMPFQEPQ